MDPLSLLCRLATSVPPPRFDTVKYAGVVAPASTLRDRIKPQTQPSAQRAEPTEDDPLPARGSVYRAWAELLIRTFDIDVLECTNCHGRMTLIALVIDLQSAARYLAKIGERTDVPGPRFQPSTSHRSNAHCPRTQCGLLRDDELQQTLDLGVAEVVMKPTTYEHLAALIRAMLDRAAA